MCKEPKKQIVITAQANDFFMSLPLPMFVDFNRAIQKLAQYGRLGIPDAKKIGDNLFELRVRADGKQGRAFYCYTIVGNVIYILSGFIKKTQRTPKQEIKKARAIMKGLGL